MVFHTQQRRYTVTVDAQKIDELSAYGVLSAAVLALCKLSESHAEKVLVVSGNGERATFHNVKLHEYSWISYDRKD